MGSHTSFNERDEEIDRRHQSIRHIDGERASGDGAKSDRNRVREKAQIVLSERQRRAVFLGKSMFGEPAWDMLLHLYTADGMALTAGKLVKLVGHPKSTLLRWAGYLEEKRLIARSNDPTDRRLVWFELAERGKQLLDAYFSSPDFPA